MKFIYFNQIFIKIITLLCFIKFKFKFNKKTEKQKVLISISLSRPGRRLLQIISHFLYCDYNIYLDISFLRYIKLDMYGRHGTLLKGVYPFSKKISYSIIASDNEKFLKDFRQEAVKIFINFNLFKYINNVAQYDLFYPIVSHKKYLSPIIESDVLSRVFTSERKIGAIFAGNVENYNQIFPKELFKIYTRDQMFFHILENLPENILHKPLCLKSFLDDIDSGNLKDKVVLLDTKIFEIPDCKWMKILLNSNFFIHMGGGIYPYCHNQIESMMAGCIPVTQFARFFLPPFQHEKNSLLFNTLDELTNLLINIASGKYIQRLETMRKYLIEYYSNNYSFLSFKNKLSYITENNISDSKYHIVIWNKGFFNELLASKINF